MDSSKYVYHRQCLIFYIDWKHNWGSKTSVNVLCKCRSYWLTDWQSQYVHLISKGIKKIILKHVYMLFIGLMCNVDQSRAFLTQSTNWMYSHIHIRQQITQGISMKHSNVRNIFIHLKPMPASFHRSSTLPSFLDKNKPSLSSLINPMLNLQTTNSIQTG